MRFWMVVALGLATLPAFADEAARRAKAKEMLAAINMRQMYDQMFDSVKGMMAPMMGDAAKDPKVAKALDETMTKVMALMRERAGWDRLEPKFVELYVEAFTEQELEDVMAFYKSTSGKAMLAKTPALMQKSMAMMQDIMRDIMPEIQKIATEGVEKAMKEK